jgi:hypothetical protein
VKALKGNVKRVMMKKIILIGLAIIAALVTGSGVYYGVQHRPIPQHEYANVELSSSKNDVKYRLGDPDGVIEDDCTKDYFRCNYRLYIVNGNDKKNALPTAKTFLEFNRWTYTQKNADGNETGYVEVDFDPKAKTVSKVSCFASATNNPFACEIIDFSRSKSDLISIGTKEDELKRWLGEPTEEKLDANSSSKFMTYNNLNLDFYLVKQKVYMITVQK